jgi:ferredoxin-thioredoxin reductase catalytic subunit
MSDDDEEEHDEEEEIRDSCCWCIYDDDSGRRIGGMCPYCTAQLQESLLAATTGAAQVK